jgi:hypothetical protein
LADILAVVKKTVWEQHDRRGGPLRPGSGPLTWRSYESNHRQLDQHLDDGDRIFLVTARPGGLLWLVAVYEDVKREPRGWVARKENRVRIVDVTHLKRKLRFHNGRGITRDDAKLGNSLQTPRRLTRSDIVHLEQAVARAGYRLTPPKVVLVEEELSTEEGYRVRHEIERFKRDPELVRARLNMDNSRCAHCGFSVNGACFPTDLRSMSRVVHVHHVRPLMDGVRTTKLTDLVTLCPTCHAVGHAIASSLGLDLVDLAVLRKHYRPSTTTR